MTQPTLSLPPDLASRVHCMREAASVAAHGTLALFQSDALRVESKGEAGPVTQADRAAEQSMRAAIAARFPHDGFLGEEYGTQSGTSGFTWVIDPIDGTVSFASGVPLYGTLLAIEQAQPDGSLRVVAGVCEMPALRERVWAVEGCGAWWEREGHAPVRAQVRACADLSQALVTTTGSEYYRRSNRLPVLARLEATVGRMRGWSDCYALVLLATGRCDAAIDPVMNPWDCGPFDVIVREAGGVFTDWKGRPGIHGGDSLAAHAATHAAMLRCIGGPGA